MPEHIVIQTLWSFNSPQRTLKNTFIFLYVPLQEFQISKWIEMPWKFSHTLLCVSPPHPSLFICRLSRYRQNESLGSQCQAMTA